MNMSYLKSGMRLAISVINCDKVNKVSNIKQNKVHTSRLPDGVLFVCQMTSMQGFLTVRLKVISNYRLPGPFQPGI
jgi:hypothetical protein